MKNLKNILIFFFLIIGKELVAQKISLEPQNIKPVSVFVSHEKLMGTQVLKVSADTTIKGFDEPTFAKIEGINLKNGTIEVKVLSRLLKNAPDWARGFIGLTFRINDENSKFESIYIRPTNGRADNQIRRNHSIQYFAYPDFKFERLRKEAPELYESYADMGLNEWINLKIELKGAKAKLFLNNSKYPVLIVNDLKLGENAVGGIGLWVGNWTEGFFKDLKVTNIN
jgi:hypothetical protein